MTPDPLKRLRVAGQTVELLRQRYEPMAEAIRAAVTEAVEAARREDLAALEVALAEAVALTPPAFRCRIHVVYQGDDTRGRPACSLTVQHPTLPTDPEGVIRLQA